MMDAQHKVNIARLIRLYLSLVIAITAVLWDHHRVTRDFGKLKDLLVTTRLAATEDGRSRIVRFIDKTVIVSDMKTGAVIRKIEVPTLHSVNYDTTIGEKMIVFTTTGTEAYNKRIHGGDMTLKSWLGFRKNIAVNCTGYTSEGLYPEDQDGQ